MSEGLAVFCFRAARKVIKRRKMKIEEINLNDLKEYGRNARTHSSEQIEQLKRSITEFGFTNPVLIDEHNVLIAGHGRCAAARALRMEKVPCIRLNGLSEAQRKALRIADNQLALNAGWDEELLKIELAELQSEDFDLDLLGFSLEEIENLLKQPDDPATDAKEDDFDEDKTEQRCKKGDVWQLGNHRLMCGDSTDAKCVEKLMSGKKADMVFTDPPYNVDYSSKNEFLNEFDKGNHVQEDIINDSYENDEEIGEKVWKPAFENMRKHSNDVCSLYVTMPQGKTHMTMMLMIHAAGWQVKNELIWVKNNHVLGRTDYFYLHEPILYGWNIKHKFYGKGMCDKSVWNIPKPLKSDLHPTMKPVELITNALLNSTKDGDNVLDLFGGSGSTLIACEQTNRKCFMMEFEEHYCDVIISRWEQLTGKKAKKV